MAGQLQLLTLLSILLSAQSAVYNIFPPTFSQTYWGGHKENVGFSRIPMDVAFFGASGKPDSASYAFEFYFRQSVTYDHSSSSQLLFAAVPSNQACCVDSRLPALWFHPKSGYLKFEYVRKHSYDGTPITRYEEMFNTNVTYGNTIQLLLKDTNWKCVKIHVRFDSSLSETNVFVVLQEGFESGSVGQSHEKIEFGDVEIPLLTNNILYIGGYDQSQSVQTDESFFGQIAAFTFYDEARTDVQLNSVYSGTACHWSCDVLWNTVKTPCALPFANTCARTIYTVYSPGLEFISQQNQGVFAESPLQIRQRYYPQWAAIGPVATASGGTGKFAVFGWFRTTSGTGDKNGQYILHISNGNLPQVAQKCTTLGATIFSLSVVSSGTSTYQLNLDIGTNVPACQSLTSDGTPGDYDKWSFFYLAYDEIQAVLKFRGTGAINTKTYAGADIVPYDGNGDLIVGAGFDQKNALKQGELYFLQVIQLDAGDGFTLADMDTQIDQFRVVQSYVSEFPNCATWTTDYTQEDPNQCTVESCTGCYPSNGRFYQCSPACNGCTDATMIGCTTCAAAGIFEYLTGPPKLCLDYCPTRHPTCAGEKSPLDLKLISTDLSSIGSPLSTKKVADAPVELVLLRSDSVYPTYGIIDSIYAGERGIYLNKSTIQLVEVVFAPSLSFLAWIRPEYDGKVFSIGRRLGYQDFVHTLKLEICYNSNYLVKADAQLTGLATNFDASKQQFDKAGLPWLHVAVTVSLDPATLKTSVSIWYQGTQLATETSAESDYFKDFLVLNHASIGDGLSGFVYSVEAHNEALSNATVVARVSTACGACGFCPATPGTCLPTCTIDQYVTSTNTCGTCLSTCNIKWDADLPRYTIGCNKSGSCNLCDDLLCFRCHSASPGDCYKCVENASLVGGKCTCNSGCLQTAEYTCQACTNPCVSCQSDGRCTGCEPGYYLESETIGCKQCMKDCIDCRAADECVKCSATTYLTPDKTCGTCDDTCDTCTGAKCVTCKPNNYLDGQTGRCLPCKSSCVSCETAGCTTCATGYVLQGGECRQTCGSSYVLVGSSCIPCSEGCLACQYVSGSLKCLQCASDQKLVSGICTCRDGQYMDNKTQQCENCKPTCGTCAGTYDNCVSCLPTQIPTATECIGCDVYTGYKKEPRSGVDMSKLTIAELERDLNTYCVEVCGDGIALGQYQCDDGNLINGDGCDELCQLEPGFSCQGPSCSD